MTTELDAQVAIVGCGPVGATLANLLGRRSVSVIVLEKQQAPYNLPRAIHFDGEVMRTFQAAGLAEKILPHTMVGRGMLFKTMDGELLIDWSRDQNIGPMGWHESYRFYQPGVEAALLAGLDRFDHVQLHRGVDVVSVSQTPDAGKLVLADGRTITVQYVVGCDGANSLVRQEMGVGEDALDFEERWLVVDLVLKVPRDDLGDYSIQFCDPARPATYVRGVGDWRRWEMRIGEDEPDPMPDEMVWEKLSRWIGPEEATLERSANYTFRSVVAEQWRNGRLFIAGDAAHQMPPFMGQGMCAGIRDTINLAWKLDHALKAGSEGILDTHFSERQANVRQFIELSVNLGRLINQSSSGNVPTGKMK